MNSYDDLFPFVESAHEQMAEIRHVVRIGEDSEAVSVTVLDGPRMCAICGDEPGHIIDNGWLICDECCESDLHVM